MTSDGYFYGATGTRYTYADIAARIREEAPQTLGKHIFVQLEAIGLLDELTNGTTPCGLPFTFAEETAAAPPTPHTPGTWRVVNRPGMPEIRAGDISIADIRLNGHNMEHGAANARRIVAAVNACDGIGTEALEAGIVWEMREALEACEVQLREYVQWHHKHAGGCSVEIEAAWEQARDTIAKATAA
jgi:hypothetical protein